jgi:hypothetical protein
MIYKTLHRKLRFEYHKLTKTGRGMRCSGRGIISNSDTQKIIVATHPMIIRE